MDMAFSTVRKHTHKKKPGGKMILPNKLREAGWQLKRQPKCGFIEKMNLTKTISGK